MERSERESGRASLAGLAVRVTALVLFVAPSLSAATHAETAAAPGCGPSWDRVASPTPGGTNRLHALSALSRARVWAVGSSVNSGGAELPLVAAWDGSSWTGSNPGAAATGDSRLSGVVAISATDAVAVGTTEAPDGSALPLVLRWNGTSWGASNPAAGPGDHRLRAVASVPGGDLVAVGSTHRAGGTTPLVLRWDGSAWSATSPAAGEGDHELTGVASLPGSGLVAVGTTSSADGTEPLVLRWDGEDWAAEHPDAGPGDHELRAAATIGQDVFAVGATTAGSATSPLVLHWDGTDWTAPDLGPATGDLNGVAAVAADDVWAVGSKPGSPAATLALHWNGAAWQAAAGPDGSSTSSLQGVDALAADDVWAAGTDGAATLIGHYGPCPGLSGTVSTAGGGSVGGVELKLSGAGSDTTTSAADGTYLFEGLAVGRSYSVTPTRTGYTFAPASRGVANLVYDRESVDFEATPIPPGAATGTASAVTLSTATLNGTVTPNGWPTSYRFEYGATVAYGSTTGSVSAGGGVAAVPVSAGVSGLQADTMYHFRVVATSAAGVTAGADRTFTTGAPTLSLAPTSATVAEGDSGNTPVTFNVTLSAASSKTVTVQYATANGTATAGLDYTALSGTLTFTTGQTAKTLTVNVLGDHLDEVDQTLTLSLADPTNASLGAATATITIDDDDTRPTATTSAATAVTQTGATLNAQVNPNGKLTSVRFEYGATTSYGSSTPAQSLPAGTTTQSVSAALSALEADRTYHFRVIASSAAGVAQGADRTFTTGGPTLALAPPSATVAEGDSGNTPVTFNVTLSAASSKTVSVQYATANGSATAGQDYTGLSGTLTFTTGQTAKTLTVNVLGDNLDENAETFTLTLSSPTNASISAAGATVTIDDDDTRATATTSAATAVTQTGATLNGQVNPNGKPATVRFEYGTTTGYGSLTPAQALPAGTTTQAVSAAVTGLSAGTTYHFRVVATSAAGVAHGTDLSFTTADSTIAVATTTPSVTEPATGTASASFSVTLSAKNSRTVTVQYATEGESATPAEDFTAASGTLSFAAGETSKTVTVTVRGDSLDEEDETFVLRLASPTNATIATGIARVTIVDDDQAPVLSVADPAPVTEGTGPGTTTITFTVGLAASSGRSVSVQYATQNGSATAPGDLGALSGTLTFASGETAKQVQVTVVRDALDEADESFSLVLANAVNATIGRATATATIRDDDEAPALWIESRSVAEGNSGTQTVSFAVRLCPPGTGPAGCLPDAAVASGLPVSAAYASADGTASAPSDYSAAAGTLAIPAGGKGGTIAVTVNGDVAFERDETFTVTLSGPTNATLARATGPGTIRNDDSAPEVSVSDATIVEGGAAKFTLALCAPGTSTAGGSCTPRPAGVTINANYVVAAGSECAHATPPAFQIVDFEHVGGQRAILAGATGTTISVQTWPDRVAEGTEHFCVGIAIPEGGEGLLGRRAGVGVILDDDVAPTVSIGDTQVTEGDDGTVVAAFTVTFSNPSELCSDDGEFCGASVQWSTVSDTATAPDDFAQATGTVTMTPPDPDTFDVQLTHRVEVAVAGDALDEPDERFAVALVTPRNAAISAAGGTGTALIADDDAPPSATTAPASAVTSATATLHGATDPSGKATTAWFEYGPTVAYGSTTTPVGLAPGGAGQTVSAPVSGLAFGTTYHFRLVARNATGITYGGSQTFVTAVPPPVAATGPAGAVSTNGATLSGTVTTYGHETGHWFEYGPTTAYGASTAAKSIPAGPAQLQVTEQLRGLSPATTYHYRLVARRGDSIAYGADQAFVTARVAAARRTLPSISLLTTRATLAKTLVVAKLKCVRAQGMCRGTLTLDASRRSLASSGGGRSVIGRHAYSARPGKTAKVGVRLSAAALRALRRTRRLSVLAVISLRDNAGAAPVRRVPMTIVLPGKRKR